MSTKNDNNTKKDTGVPEVEIASFTKRQAELNSKQWTDESAGGGSKPINPPSGITPKKRSE